MTTTSKIIMGQQYRDTITGFEGQATAIYEYLHGCTRVNLSGRKVDANGNAEPVEYAFDSPQLVHVETGDQVVASKPGGPGKGNEAR